MGKLTPNNLHAGGQSVKTSGLLQIVLCDLLYNVIQTNPFDRGEMQPELSRTSSTKAHVPDRWLVLWWVLSILAVSLLPGCSGTNGQPGGAQNRISQQNLEDRYGMRITLVAVTANSGLIDVRVKVMDANKASQIMTDTADSPHLLIEKTGAVLNAADDAPERRSLEDGMLYFFLYPNVNTVVAEGTPVVVDFGEVQVEPIPAVK